MGDWERIFGAGVSAESVINGINASWEGQHRKEELREELRDLQIITAYRGDDKIKDALLSQLVDHHAAGLLAKEDSGLKSLLINCAENYGKIEDDYKIPEELARLVDVIFTGLKNDPGSTTKSATINSAINWLYYCMNAIKPGVDLRFIAPKFAATVAHAGFWTKRDDVRNACEPALAIAYIRARGVIVQDELAVAAAKAAWSAMGEASALAKGNIRREDLAAAIAGAAADPKSECAALVACYGALARIPVNRRAGEFYTHEKFLREPTQFYTWEGFSRELVQLIEAAPTERLEILNLNEITLQLFGACQQKYPMSGLSSPVLQDHAHRPSGNLLASVTEHHDDNKLPDALLRQLQGYREAGRLIAGNFSNYVLLNSELDYAEIEANYRIPEALARLMDMVFKGLNGYPSFNPKAKAAPESIDWLFACVDAIKPGVDLRFIASRFAALVAIGGFWLPKEGRQGGVVRNACAPALAIADARARGVIVQDEVAVAAVKAAWSVVCEDWEQWLWPKNLTEADLGAMIVGTAADIKPESAARVAYYAALACIGDGGTADEFRTWQVLSDDLIVIIETAPMVRLRSVDLNEVAAQLFDPCQQKNP